MNMRILYIKFLLILTSLLLTTNTFSQRLPFYLKAYTPEYILEDSEFEVSLLLRFFDLDADEIVLHVLTEDDLSIENVILQGENVVEFPFSKSELSKSRYEDSYNISFDLSNPEIDYNSFINLVLSLNSETNSPCEISFIVDYLKNGSIIKSLSKDDFFENDNVLPEIELDFYRPQRTAGNSLQLDRNTFFNLSFNYEEYIGNTLIEFWSKFQKPGGKFLSFVNSISNETLFSIDVGKIVSSNNLENLEFFKDYFIAKDSWYHISAFIYPENQRVDVYLNDELVASIKSQKIESLNQFEVVFNNSSEGKIEIDQLRIWEYNNSPHLSFFNKNYQSYEADSSQSLLNMSFDEERQFNISVNSNIAINHNSIDYTISTAPIFSKAPELSAFLYDNFCQIEWKSKSKETASFFELHKSVDGVNFVKVFETFASENPAATYYYSDPKDNREEVAYYRVKQINTDETEVFSSSVKIGLGEIQYFVLGQNYPNPFNPETTISIEVLKPVEVDIYVYDIVGKKVAKLSSGVLSQGVHTFLFDGSNLPSGIYFCEAKSPSFTDVRKMILAK